MQESEEIAFGRRIDIHTHIGSSLSDPPKVWERIIRQAAHFGITRLVALGNLGGFEESWDPSPDLITRTNTYTLELIARHPDVCMGFCYLNPANPVRFLEDEIERCVVKGGMRGIKFEVAVKATDSRLDPIMCRARALGIPVLHHSWYNVLSPVYNESTPADMANLGRRFPEVTIIMAHLGGGRERGVLDIMDVPNILVDTAGSQPESGMVEYAVQRLGAERVIYGSDHPIRDFGAQLGRVLGAQLSVEERELILYGNAARVLGLEGEAP